MAVHEEPNGGERGRAVADRVPLSSLFGAEAISSVGNNITTLAVPYMAVTLTMFFRLALRRMDVPAIR
jgi:hypothetical protein